MASAGSNGATLPKSESVSFVVATGDVLRLQQLLAQLDFLPVAFVPSGPPPTTADLAQDQPGTFTWRWPGQPARAHVPMDAGHREHDHQGRGRGLRNPERHRRRRDRGTGGMDRSHQRHHQPQGGRHFVRVRPREQSGPREPHAVEQRSGAVRGDPRQHGCARCGHRRRDLCRLRARAVLRDEGDESRRHHLRRPQCPLCQLLQRWRRTARLHPRQLRDPAEQRLRRDALRRCCAGMAAHAHRHAGHGRRAQPGSQSSGDDDHDRTGADGADRTGRTGRTGHDDHRGSCSIDDDHDRASGSSSSRRQLRDAAG